MKIIFISDIHGSLYYAKKVMECVEKENADQIVILGDILYHGPRNQLPKDYNPSGVADLLNTYKNKIIAVRGNCDSEVDQMVIDYPMMSDYVIINMDGYKIFATHGHIYNKDKMPELNKGDVFIHGHFHLPMAEEMDGVFYLNPGSIAIPKENKPNTYGVLENNEYKIKTIYREVIKSIKLK